MAPCNIVSCTYERHGAAILDILNEAILHSTALYDYRPRTMDSMADWFQAREAGRYPVIGAEGPEGELAGFATYGRFRDRPAYKYTVEHSVYVHHRHRGEGLGTALMQRLITLAEKQDFHVMVGGIDQSNRASVALHEKLGFEHAGTIRHAGFKFGRWLDLAFYQLVLATPAQPLDG
ncbi:MAG TPA: GNAT family N-acetyltransferase [Burkholderiales bacterium]|nr:GNAT family N-acetyltransferase [Burkholderiales bacterium]